MCSPFLATSFLIQSISRALDVRDEFQILAGRVINALNIWNRFQYFVSHEWSVFWDGCGEKGRCHCRPNTFQIWQCCDCLLKVWQFTECLFCFHHHRSRRVHFDQIWQLRVVFATLNDWKKFYLMKIDKVKKVFAWACPLPNYNPGRAVLNPLPSSFRFVSRIYNNTYTLFPFHALNQLFMY